MKLKITLLSLCAWILLPTIGLAAPEYAGGESCLSCHQQAYEAWQGSHHQLAMQEAQAASVLGNFNQATFAKGGITTTFFRDGERFMVNTDGPDGELQDYEVSYVFGVYPLQQYMVAFPGGRLQVLDIAWDSRPEAEGGQRWFSLHDCVLDQPQRLLCQLVPDPHTLVPGPAVGPVPAQRIPWLIQVAVVGRDHSPLRSIEEHGRPTDALFNSSSHRPHQVRAANAK